MFSTLTISLLILSWVIGQASDLIPRQGKGHLPDFRKKIQPAELKILLSNLFRLLMEFKETIFLDGAGDSHPIGLKPKGHLG
jgi:hypothetical protein